MIGLAFFDDSVELMVAALSLECKDEPFKRIQMEPKDIGTKKLSDFVTTDTRQFFVALDIPPPTCFGVEIKLWQHSGSVPCQGGKSCKNAAEYGISLIQSLNAAITNQEAQNQFLL